jgi:hypothetical protein
MLVKLAQTRFGALSPAQLEQIRAASIEQLDAYAERVLSAGSLDELLAD